MPANKRRARTNNATIVKPNPTVLAANNLKSAVALGAVIAQNGIDGSALTLKEQQQLDRNAYLSTLTKDQLRVECRKRGQKNTGTKAELVRRHSSIPEWFFVCAPYLLIFVDFPFVCIAHFSDSRFL